MQLSEWYRKRALLPHGALSILVLIFCFFQLWNAFEVTHHDQEQALATLGRTVSLGLSQRNRPLLERALEQATDQLRPHSLALCREKRIEVASNWGTELCGVSPANVPFGNRFLRTPISGFEGYHLEAMVPVLGKWGKSSRLVGLFGMVVLLLVGGAVLISQILTRIRTELIYPLQRGLSQKTALPITELESLRRAQETLTDLEVQAAVNAATLSRNQQVAHDIRSPLAALGVVAFQASVLAPESRELLNTAIRRIREIVKDLSLSRDPMSSASTEELELRGPIQEVVEEIRAQIAANSQIAVNLSIKGNPRSRVNGPVFQRVIANLLTNSLESLRGTRGEVRLQLTGSDREPALLEISDTGEGMSKEVLSRLGERGFSYAKPNGTGLGFFHARESLREWGWSVSVQSEPGKGTSVRLQAKS